MGKFSTLNNLFGWLVAVAGTAVYLLTLEPTVSFWDCGEFIATSYKFQIGHPPGAPLYQLLAHCFMLLAGGQVDRLAWWSNALSAVAGGLTAMFLFWTLVRLLSRWQGVAQHRWQLWLSAAVGSACYLFCDTAWFSAVESEVYSLSMLISSVVVWSTIRWAQCSDRSYAPRWMLLSIFLLVLSVGVHQLSLLTIPMLVLVVLMKRHSDKRKASAGENDGRHCLSKSAWLKLSAVGLLLVLIGLTPNLIIPIRARVNPPINQGNPSDWQSFRAYVNRDQYEKAPLIYGRCFNSPIVAYNDGKPVYAKEMDMFFPRMWARHDNAERYYTDWTGRHGKMVRVEGRDYYKPSFGDNMMFFGSYHLGYMYFRYLMWNFSGRYNDQQGFGNLHRGQFITGIPPVDKLYMGVSAPMPSSMSDAAHNRYFLLPLLLGIVGFVSQLRRDRRGFWAWLTLFLMSGVVLVIYLNHPLYEPRERDYAYVLSFYAFAAWTGLGAYALLSHQYKRPKMKKVLSPLALLAVLSAPVLMGCQNWNDHDRSGRYIARDSALNLLNSCSDHALLFTIGDNDTFPLWYLQQVEGVRTDVQIINLSLLGTESYCNSVRQQLLRQGSNLLPNEEWTTKGPFGRLGIILENNDFERPVFFSQYAFDDNKERFSQRMQLCGIAYRLMPNVCDSVDWESSYRLMTDQLHWQPLENIYIDETSRSFLRQYWKDAVLVAENLVANGFESRARCLLDSVEKAIPLSCLCDLPLVSRVAQAYLSAGDNRKGEALMQKLRVDLQEQMNYYGTMSPAMQRYIPYVLVPLIQLDSVLRMQTARMSDPNRKEVADVI